MLLSKAENSQLEHHLYNINKRLPSRSLGTHPGVIQFGSQVDPVLPFWSAILISTVAAAVCTPKFSNFLIHCSPEPYTMLSFYVSIVWVS